MVLQAAGAVYRNIHSNSRERQENERLNDFLLYCTTTILKSASQPTMNHPTRPPPRGQRTKKYRFDFFFFPLHNNNSSSSSASLDAFHSLLLFFVILVYCLSFSSSHSSFFFLLRSVQGISILPTSLSPIVLTTITNSLLLQQQQQEDSSCSHSCPKSSIMIPSSSSPLKLPRNKNSTRSSSSMTTTVSSSSNSSSSNNPEMLSSTSTADAISLLSSSSSSEESSITSSHKTNESYYLEEAAQTEVMEPHIGYKKVLVTGGAGFIGSHVAEHLLERGDNVVIVDEINDYYDVSIKESNIAFLQEKYSDRISFYRGDICDETLMRDVFEKERPEWVCHLAARAGVRPSIDDPFVYIHSNVRGTTLLMELSHRYKVKNFVFASSSSVYGGSKSTYFSEDEPVDNPVSPYAATKKACELLAYNYHHLYKLNVSGLRFFTVYGERGRPDMAPFMFIDRISRGLDIKQFGDGTSSRDYTYISDIVDGVIRSIDRPYPYQIFNLGKGMGTSLKEFIHIVQKHTGKKATVKVLPDQPGDVPYTCADVTKASVLLGYQAKVSFEEGIRRTVEWYNQNHYLKERRTAIPAAFRKKKTKAPQLETRGHHQVVSPSCSSSINVK
jgi:Nucleoside-diphosphate-sugar epimerases